MKVKAGISFALLAIFVQWAHGHEISGDLIKGIQYGVNNKGQVEIHIQFSLPTQIVGDIKTDEATRADLRVQFHLTENEAKLLPLEEVKVADADPQIPLHSITFDGFNVSEHVFQIQFNKKVFYKISQEGADAIKISLPEVFMQETPINRVDPAEVARLKEQLRQRQAQPNRPISKPPSPPVTIAAPGDVPTLPPKPRTQQAPSLDDLMAQGQAALDAGKYKQAISLYNKVLNKGNPDYMPKALEMLGVAREKNGQIGMARRIYEQYLAQYAKTADDKERLRSRLSNIQPKISRDRKKRRRPVIVGVKRNLFGSLSLFNFSGEQELAGRTTEIDSLRSFINLNGRVQTNRYDIRTAFYGTATQHNDLSSGSSKKEQEYEANQVYLDYRDEKWGLNAKMGRQSGNTAGIFGRFDGFLMGYRVLPTIKINTAYGYTVDFTAKDKIQTNLPFTAFSLNLGPYKEYLQFSPYLFKQEVDGVTNRSAVGLETRWTNPVFEVFNLVDYATNFGKVNFALFNSVYRFSDKTRLNLNYDRRRNPNLELRAALNRSNLLYDVCSGVANSGESFRSIEHALTICNEDEISDFIKLYAGQSQLMTLSLNRSFSRTNQLSLDVSKLIYQYKNLTPEQEDINVVRFEEEKEDADQVSTGLQWMLSDVLAKRDSNIYSLRYVVDENYTSTRYSFSYRFSYGRSLRFIVNYNGELRTNSKLEADPPGSQNFIEVQQKRHRPSFKFDYKFGKSLQLQFDLIYDVSRYNIAGRDSDMYLMTLGLRQIF